MRNFIAILSVTGTVFFGMLLVLSYLSPTTIQKFARVLIEMEVENRVAGKIDQLEQSKVGKIGTALSQRNTAEIAQLKREIAKKLPERIAKVGDAMLDPNCECRKTFDKMKNSALEGRLKMLSKLEDRLTELIHHKYMEVSTALMQEFRIFSAANAFMFVLLGSTLVLRKRANLQLILPALMVLGAVGIVGFLYVFEQNWLHTIVFGDYIGLGYFAYLGIAVAFLSDILFNHANITTAIFNATANTVGLAAQAVCC